MLRDITLGQYYPVDSVLHRMDPRTKLFGTLVYIVTLFIADSVWAYGLAALFLAAAIRLSRVPVKFMVRGLKSIVILLLISVSFNLFLTPGTPIFKIGFLQMTWEGLEFAAFMAVRLIFLVLGSTILTLTTTPNQLTDGLEKSLGFMGKIGVPVHEVSMMMSIALRFIPTLIEETDKIMSAQKARGADFESGKLMERAKSLIPILVPLFISAFRRADELATAMECRCYQGGEGRTKMKQLHYQRNDFAAFGAAALLYGGMAGLGSGQVWEAVGCAVPILVSAFVILYLYNGRRAARGRTFYKWFFYAFYPAHLLVLGMLFMAK